MNFYFFREINFSINTTPSHTWLSARCIMPKHEKPLTMTPDEIQKAINNLDALVAKRYEVTGDEILQKLVKYDYIVKYSPDALTSTHIDQIAQLAQASHVPFEQPRDKYQTEFGWKYC